MSEITDYWKPQLEKADATISRLSEIIDQQRKAQDEADALLMELIGVPFPVAYPTDCTKATAMRNWKARCVERGHQQSGERGK